MDSEMTGALYVVSDDDEELNTYVYRREDGVIYAKGPAGTFFLDELLAPPHRRHCDALAQRDVAASLYMFGCEQPFQFVEWSWSKDDTRKWLLDPPKTRAAWRAMWERQTVTIKLV